MLHHPPSNVVAQLRFNLPFYYAQPNIAISKLGYHCNDFQCHRSAASHLDHALYSDKCRELTCMDQNRDLPTQSDLATDPPFY
jgi:hypothetical protein